jgi:hypothetical protein
VVELITLVVANLVATTVRFLLLRAWITPASCSGDRRIESTSGSRAEPVVRRVSGRASESPA